MTSNPHIRLITAVAAKFLVLNSKFDRVPHPWQRQPSRRKISRRQVVVLFGASRSRGCWYEPDSRCDLLSHMLRNRKRMPFVPRGLSWNR